MKPFSLDWLFGCYAQNACLYNSSYGTDATREAYQETADWLRNRIEQKIRKETYMRIFKGAIDMSIQRIINGELDFEPTGLINDSNTDTK